MDGRFIFLIEDKGFSGDPDISSINLIGSKAIWKQQCWIKEVYVQGSKKMTYCTW